MSEESIEDSKAPLIEHFIELRTRIIRSVIFLAFAFFIAFVISEEIYLFLVNPYAVSYTHLTLPTINWV